jgi:hypothetical protein
MEPVWHSVDMSWPALASLFALLNAVCVAIDKLHNRHSKLAVHDRLVRLWGHLKEARIPAIPQHIARKLSERLMATLRSPKDAFYGCAVLVVLSLLLTSQAVAVGAAIDSGGHYRPFLLLDFGISRVVWALLVNLMFDVIAVGLTVIALSALSQTTNAWGAFKIASYSVLFGCIIVEKAFGAYASIFNGFHLFYFYIAYDYLFRHNYWIESLYTTRMVIPLLLFVWLIAFIFLADALLATSVNVAKYVVGIEAEKTPYEIAPWTFVGVLLTVAACIAKLIADLLQHGGP